LSVSVEQTSQSPASSHPNELARAIGVGGVAFTAFNCVVGVGIFGLPALVAGVLGTASIVAYGVCLVLVGLVGLCFAEAGSRVPASGGIYSFAEAAFGPVAGGIAGALLLVANCIGSAAAVARFFLDTLGTMWPLFAQPTAAIALLTVIYTVLAWVNIHGVRDGSRITVGIGIVKLIPLISLVAAGVFAIHPANLAWPGMPPPGKIGEGALILVFAFTGSESCLNLAGETRNAERNIPRGIALALCMIAALYIGLQLTAQGVLGPALSTSQAPLVDTARAVFGSSMAQVIALLALFSSGGYLIADMLSAPRVGYALAHAGQLPRWVGYVQPQRKTPAASIVFYAVMVVVVTASGTFRQLAMLAVAGTLLLYLITCLGLLRLRAKGVMTSTRPFVAPGGAVVPLAAAAIMIWLLSTLARGELLVTTGFVGVMAVVYAIVHRRVATTARA